MQLKSQELLEGGEQSLSSGKGRDGAQGVQYQTLIRQCQDNIRIVCYGKFFGNSSIWFLCLSISLPSPSTSHTSGHSLSLLYSPYLILSNKDILFLTAAIAMTKALGRIIQEPLITKCSFSYYIWAMKSVVILSEWLGNKDFIFSQNFLFPSVWTHTIFIRSHFGTYVGYKHPKDKEDSKTQQDKTSRAG